MSKLAFTFTAFVEFSTKQCPNSPFDYCLNENAKKQYLTILEMQRELSAFFWTFEEIALNTPDAACLGERNFFSLSVGLLCNEV